MNEIIKVNEDTMTVSGRDLHEALEIKERFSVWMERQVAYFGDEITTVCTPTEVRNNGGVQVRDLTDFNVSIDNAKHICLMSRTEKGREVRQYFIDLEKAWNTPEQILARALKVADQTIANLSVQVKQLAVENEELKPKADFYDAVTDSKQAIPMGDVAKVLDMGMGRNKLFEFLRNNNILQQDNRPYQKYIDRGYFRVVEQKFDKPYGEIGINIKTLVFQSGVDYIRRKIVEAEKQGIAEWNA